MLLVGGNLGWSTNCSAHVHIASQLHLVIFGLKFCFQFSQQLIAASFVEKVTLHVLHFT